jgi:hypothetical protein
MVELHRIVEMSEKEACSRTIANDHRPDDQGSDNDIE